MDHATGRALAYRLAAIPAPIFLAGLDLGRTPQLTLHLQKRAANRHVRRQGADAAAEAGLDLKRVTVQGHAPRALTRPRTIETLLRGFRHEHIVLDPTGAFGRAARLVDLARALREALDAPVAGVFFAPAARLVYVLMDSAGFVDAGQMRVERLQAAEHAARTALRNIYPDGGAPGLRLSLSFPEVSVTPVDDASVRARKAFSARLKLGAAALAATAAAGLGAATPAAAEGPAVEQSNALLGGGYASMADESGAYGAFSATAPFGQNFGGQIDAAYASSGEGFGGVAGQLFWRDPDAGLLGLVAGYAQSDDVEVSRLAAKGELYLGQFTLMAQAGGLFTDSDDTTYGSFDLRWYIADNIYVSGGGVFEENTEYARFQAEFLPGFDAMPGLAFFARGTVGDDGSDSIMIGLSNQFFGVAPSLIDRDRRYLVGNEAFAMMERLQREATAYGGYDGGESGEGGESID